MKNSGMNFSWVESVASFFPIPHELLNKSEVPYPGIQLSAA